MQGFDLLSQILVHPTLGIAARLQVIEIKKSSMLRFGIVEYSARAGEYRALVLCSGNLSFKKFKRKWTRHNGGEKFAILVVATMVFYWSTFGK